MENGKIGLTNPFVRISDEKKEKNIVKAFLHPNDGGYYETAIGSNNVVNPFIHDTVSATVEKKPIVKAFLHEGDEGYEKVTPLSETNAMPGKQRIVSAVSVASVHNNVAEANNSKESEENNSYHIARDMVASLDIRRCAGKLFIRRVNVHEMLDAEKLEGEVLDHLKRTGSSIKRSKIKDICYFLDIDNDIREETGSSTSYMAFTNGVVLDNTLRYVSIGYDVFLSHRVNAAYNPALSGMCPTAIRFIEAAMGGNPILIKRVWQAIAFVISNAPVKKFLILEGVGDSGKSQLMSLFENLFDNDNFPLKLKEFEDKFLIERISGRKLICCADLPKSVLSETAVGNIKAITGGDRINGQAKFKTPYKLETGGSQRLVFATNHAIILKEKDDAFDKRTVYIPFVNAVPIENQDPQLLNKLISEKDAIVTTALQYLPELLATNFTFAGEEETDAMLSVYNAFANREFSGIVEDFLAENIELAPDVFTSTDELLKAFAERTGVVIDISNFGKYIKEALFRMSPAITEARATINGVKHRGYSGIRIKEADV